MKKYLVLLAASLSVVQAAQAAEYQLWISYRLPKDAESELIARDLQANALSHRNLELQACSRGKAESDRERCEESAEITFRQRLLAIPGLKFALTYSPKYSDGDRVVTRPLMDLTATEVSDRSYDFFLHNLQPGIAESMGTVIDTSDCIIRSFYDRTVRIADEQFESVVCKLLSSGSTATVYMWDLMKNAYDTTNAIGDFTYLLKHGANPNAVGVDEESSALAMAANHGLLEEAKLLIKYGARVNYRDKSGRSPISWAAVAGRYALTKLLIEKNANIHVRDNEGFTPLGLAADHDSLEVVRLLADNGAAVDTRQDNVRHLTPLLLAAYHGNTELAAYLVGKGANVNARDASGNTPLYSAMSRGDHEIVELLKRNGGTL